jgi:ATP-dependent exoDNAse (exonuclease V) alpha subunit
MNKKPEELSGTLASIRFRSDDGGFVVARLKYDGVRKIETPEGTREIPRTEETTIVGADPTEDLTPGMEFRLLGSWQDTEKFGPQFSFSQFVRGEPSTRSSIVAYLKKHAPGVGPAIGGRLFDAYGSAAVKALRLDPESVAAAIKGLTLKQAIEAAKVLEDLVELETTKIELSSILDGRGFPKSLEAELLKKYSLKAPERLKRDPFFLLLESYPGAGFQRVDKLFLDMGHNPASLKRQTLCLWNLIKSDRAGHSWYPVELAAIKLRAEISSSEIDPAKALRLGVRAKLLRERTEEGRDYFTTREAAEDEESLAGFVLDLLGVDQDFNFDTTTPEEVFS